MGIFRWEVTIDIMNIMKYVSPSWSKLIRYLARVPTKCNFNDTLSWFEIMKFRVPHSIKQEHIVMHTPWKSNLAGRNQFCGTSSVICFPASRVWQRLSIPALLSYVAGNTSRKPFQSPKLNRDRLVWHVLLKKTSTLNSLKHHFYRTWVLNQAPLSKNIRSILKDFQEYTNAKDQPFLEEFSTWHLLPTHAKGTTSCLKDTFFGTSSRLQTCWWVQSTAEQRNTFHVTLGAIGKS